MKDNKTQPIDEPSKTVQSPGVLLRQAREASGQTCVAVGEALHLTGQYIRALENDDYSKLPGLTFVKGYIKSYARYLKLDVDVVMDCYARHLTTLPEIKSFTLAGNYTRKRNDQAIAWAVVAALIVVIALGAGWWFVGRPQSAAVNSTFFNPPSSELSNQGVSNPQYSNTATNAAGMNTVVSPTLPTADVVRGATAILPANEGVPNSGVIVASQAPVEAASQGATQPSEAAVTVISAANEGANGLESSAATVTEKVSAAGGRQVNLVASGVDKLLINLSGDSWVEVDDGQHVRLYNEILRKGDVLNIQGQAPFEVLLGDAHNATVSFNDSSIDFANNIRTDKTARLRLNNPATQTAELSPAPTASVGGAQ